MKQLYAIIMLVIYTAFTSSAAIAGHECSRLCIKSADTHSAFPNANTGSAECTEKEVVSFSDSEHRAGSLVKVHAKCRSFNKNITYENYRRFSTPVTRDATAYIASHELTEVPIYILHCVYRL